MHDSLSPPSDTDYNHLPCNPFLNKTSLLKLQDGIHSINLTALLENPDVDKECILNLTLDGGFLLNGTNYSKSLIIFIILISIASCISVVVELCLVLIDSPIEIYRFLSYTYGQSWLCRFHTFCESLLSSCIIFYHLLGAIDRFVYVYGQTMTTQSIWSKCNQSFSSKKNSFVLLFIPLIVSLPIAITNTLHSYVIRSPKRMMTCVVQYTQYKFIIIILVSFYILPIILSFILHTKLIYYIRSRHKQQYITTYLLPPTNSIRHNYQTMDLKVNYDPSMPNRTTLLKINPRHRHRMHNTTTETRPTKGTTNTTNSPTSPTAQSSASSGSSTTTNTNSSIHVSRPIVIYKLNSQACANARKTVILLVTLLTFYVCCWAPSNIYTWIHTYQLIETEKKTTFSIKNLTNNHDISTSNYTSLINNLPKSTSFHSNLKRMILINYSLYFLSVISMWFSFIFYFTLNKQARLELKRLLSFTIYCGSRRKQPKHRYQQQQYLPVIKYNYTINHYNYSSHRQSKKKQKLVNINSKDYKNTVMCNRHITVKYGCNVKCSGST
ncbi:unnamed protein product [Didymodactylos carnosus]|uniref:G-protein coupled receptors family 1 profile domain-containing protein n=1 Tax=Didymodactylos carnosus TaxID=1234261 RepID=A0A8S2E4F0_9BILA|nr:unnamed protein product [Didymodactylos carnosus]CAF3911426.1 unnamed protein product [Didymodactylos carnosus]